MKIHTIKYLQQYKNVFCAEQGGNCCYFSNLCFAEDALREADPGCGVSHICCPCATSRAGAKQQIQLPEAQGLVSLLMAKVTLGVLDTAWMKAVGRTPARCGCWMLWCWIV